MWGIQGFLSFLALGSFVWTLTTFLKIRLWGKNPLGLYSWTYIFYRPVEGHLVNYLAVCLAFGLCGLLIYLLMNRFQSKGWPGSTGNMGLWGPLFSVAVSLLLLGFSFRSTDPGQQMAAAFFVFILPLFLWLVPRIAALQAAKANRWLLFLTLLLLVAAAVEPVRMMMGPVHLMNEYIEIHGQTILEGKEVPNEEFLKTLKSGDLDTIRAFFEARNRIDGLPPQPPGSKTGRDLFQNQKSFQVSFAQGYIQTLIQIANPEDLDLFGKGFRRAEGYLKGLKAIEVEKIRDFYFANLLETLHQTMGRGQMNHIGHILNPINEFILGKPLENIYFQYGIGYTFLLKWIMERTGGISIENYYKTYFFYVLYFLLFFGMVWLLFPDRRYAFAAFAVLPLGFYFLGYIAFLLAPGVLPSLHLLDVPVTVLIYCFFRRPQARYAVPAMVLCLAGIGINRNFGVALSVALAISLFLYILEVEKGKRRAIWIFGGLVFILALISVFAVSDVGAGGKVFPYYLSGFYSWPAHGAVIGGTLLYLIGSYFLIFWLRGDRSARKYLYLFVFMYSQIALAYYFWSGLINHLPPVFAFVWLQLLLTLDLLREKTAGRGNFWEKTISMGVQAVVILVAGGVLFFGLRFYNEKNWFQANFANHSVYQWTFDRAKLISTIPPRLIQDSVALIQKYSPKDRPGMYIISRYDGLLPFLAHRFSAMPFFEMISFLYSERERDEAVRRIRDHKPEYLFADRSIQFPWEDRWAVLNHSEFFLKERASHFGRHEVLREIFLRVRDGYEKIEDGGLISVYKRKMD